MSQICYNIYNRLAGKKHVREIAKILGTNQTTVARKLIELEKENVVDFVFEGKNKYYFRKD